VITGEGRLDATSALGKVTGGVAALCMAAGRRLIVITGDTAPEPLGPPFDAAEVISLVDRFGRNSAESEPVASVEKAVAAALSTQPVAHRD
jgi:Glycerate kinase family